VSSTESNLTLRSVGAGWKYQSGYVLRTSEVCITQTAASAQTDGHPMIATMKRARVMYLPGSYVARSRSVEQPNWDIDAKVGEIAGAITQQARKVNDLFRRGIGRHTSALNQTHPARHPSTPATNTPDITLVGAAFCTHGGNCVNDPQDRGGRACSLRVAFVVSFVLFFLAVLLFVFLFIWLFSHEDIGTYRVIGGGWAEVFWRYSAHAQWYAS
jgi:hypothetical protein